MENKMWIIIIVILILAGGFYYMKLKQESNKPKLSAVIVDKTGKIIEEIMPTFSIVTPGSGGAFSKIDNVNTFLAIRSTLDNSEGDSEVQIREVSGSNLCNTGNTNPGCSTIANKYGSGIKECNINIDGTVTCPTNDGYGAINALYASRFSASNPLIMPGGSIDLSLFSEPMKVNDLQLGLVKFRLDLTDVSYKDAQGALQPLTGVFGELLLNIQPDACSEGTTADITPGTNEMVSCSSVMPGKYCMISYLGNPTLVDKASFCGCPGGFLAVGDVCVDITDCGAPSWPIGTCNPDGGILYCQSTGNVIFGCNACFAQCPLNSKGKSAIGCSSTIDPSICTYPTGLIVRVETDIPIGDIQACGDGVKESSLGEECDTTDFQGITCTDLGYSSGILTCNIDCTYNVGGCS